MSRQLRLVDPPPRQAPAGPGRSSRRRDAGRARRAVRAADWRLDSEARVVGRRGVAEARAALARAAGPEPRQLPKAS